MEKKKDYFPRQNFMEIPKKKLRLCTRQPLFLTKYVSLKKTPLKLKKLIFIRIIQLKYNLKEIFSSKVANIS